VDLNAEVGSPKSQAAGAARRPAAGSEGRPISYRNLKERLERG